MLYVLSIDWLSVYGIYAGDGDIWHPAETKTFTYKHEAFGTRCFSMFNRVRTAND